MKPRSTRDLDRYCMLRILIKPPVNTPKQAKDWWIKLKKEILQAKDMSVAEKLGMILDMWMKDEL